MNKNNKIILSVILVVLFYVIFTISSDVYKITQNFDKMQINYLFPILGTYVLVMFVSSVRQKFILKKLGLKISTKDSFVLLVAGLSMIITPFGSGLAIKTYYMKKKYGYEVSKTFPMIIVERFNDLIIVSSIVVISLLWYFSEIAIIVSTISFTILGIFIFALLNKPIFKKFKKIMCKMPFFKNIFHETVEIDSDVKKLLKVKTLSVSLILTGIGVTLEILVVLFAFNAFNIKLSFLEIAQIYYTSIIGGALSLIPGGVGLTEISFVGLMTEKNVTVNLSTSLIIFIRMTTIWFATGLGFIFSIVFLKRNLKK